MLKFPLSRDIMCFKSQVEGRSRGSKITLNSLPPGLLQLISYLVSTWSCRRLGRGYFGGGCGCLGRGDCAGTMVDVIICLSGWWAIGACVFVCACLCVSLSLFLSLFLCVCVRVCVQARAAGRSDYII